MLTTLPWLIAKAFSWRCCKYGCYVQQHQHSIHKWVLACTSWGKVAAKVPEVRELHAHCLTTSSTSHSGVVVMEVVLEPFSNFQFDFWLESFGDQVFYVGNLVWSVVVLGWVFSTPVAISNMVNLLPFEASFLDGCRNSTTFDALLYMLTYYHNVSKLLSWATYHMFIVWCLECVSK